MFSGGPVEDPAPAVAPDQVIMLAWQLLLLEAGDSSSFSILEVTLPCAASEGEKALQPGGGVSRDGLSVRV